MPQESAGELVRANPKTAAWDTIGADYYNRGYDGGPTPADCDLYLHALRPGDTVLLAGASTVRLASAAVQRGLMLTVADFSTVMLTELERLLGGQAIYVQADVTNPGAVIAGKFRAIIADRLLNRFTLAEMRSALTLLCGVLDHGGQLRMSYRLGLYERDRPVLDEARRRGQLAEVFDEGSYDIDYSAAREWLAGVLPPHGSIGTASLVEFYAARGREHRLRPGELDALLAGIAAEHGWELQVSHLAMDGKPSDYLLQAGRP
jgi:hypothetical protein